MINQSILTSIKLLLGIPQACTDFDNIVIMHINSVFMILNQIGVGPTQAFTIDSDTQIWMQFVKEKDQLEAVKSYMYLKVKLLFDPPLNSNVTKAMEQQINELEWRLNVGSNQE